MAELTALNGAPLSSDKKRHIELDYDLRTCRLNIGGELDNLDLAINILEQAARYLKNQQTCGMILQAGQQQIRDARLVEQVFKPQ